eukprot:TRINITY_DN15426_c0_g1_i1.p1 TRINITY_DN15426_c0_g1~~TRINITY_DN15426_c0_g1_i1.p1  ORF type:complete len:213 (+),score=38.58 TRINITY_DN15426_c0_g1_i1:117-755(+)
MNKACFGRRLAPSLCIDLDDLDSPPAKRPCSSPAPECVEPLSERTQPKLSSQSQQHKVTDVRDKDDLEGLFTARGLSAQVSTAVAHACVLRKLTRSHIRSLAAALSRSGELRSQVESGALLPNDFADMPAETLATPQQLAKRRSDAAKALKECLVDPHADAFALVCEECGDANALGTLVKSTSGGKPMMGSTRLVKRGECVACGHVWLDTGR